MKLLTNNQAKSPFVIGICGRSCSGKGVLCDKIASVNKNVLLLKMDIFFRRGTSCHYKGHDCIEHTDCIRFDHLIEIVRALKKGQSCTIHSETPWLSQGDMEISSEDLKLKDLIIVEGFLLFTNKRLVELFDHRIFMDISDLNIMYRRLLRENSLDRIHYIYDVIIPVSKEYEQEQKRNAKVIFDGNQSKKEVLQDVATHLNNKLADRKPQITTKLSLKQQPWTVYPGDLVSDGEWHPIDYDNLKDWVKLKRDDMYDGEERKGDHFRYIYNNHTGDYEIRLSSKYNMLHYNPP